MTPTQFRAALKRLDLPLAELARRVRVHVRTVRRWASGEVAVPESVALLLACWLRER
jgi:DNA-binding transcriptional regulator YiaG